MGKGNKGEKIIENGSYKKKKKNQDFQKYSLQENRYFVKGTSRKQETQETLTGRRRRRPRQQGGRRPSDIGLSPPWPLISSRRLRGAAGRLCSPLTAFVWCTEGEQPPKGLIIRLVRSPVGRASSTLLYFEEGREKKK